MSISVAEARARGLLRAARIGNGRRGGLHQSAERELLGLKQTEEHEQMALVEWFDAEFPSLAPALMHLPNGGSRNNRFEGWRFAQMGVRAGASDLLLAQPVGRYAGLFCEMKAKRPLGRRPTPEQIGFLNDKSKRGYATAVCFGAEEAKAVIRLYLSGADVEFDLDSLAKPKRSRSS